MARMLFIIAVFFLLPSVLIAQAGKDSKLWSESWSSEREIHKSVVMIRCKLDSVTSTGGSGCLIEGRGIITAAHVVDGSCEIIVKFFDGTEIKAKTKAFDTGSDFALLELESDPPAGCPHSRISSSELTIGDEVEVCGFAGNDGLRHFNAKVMGSDGKRVVIAGYVAQGDSGGPIFNAAGEVVSVVSGGSIWLKNQTLTGKASKVTTPIIGPVARNQR